MAGINIFKTIRRRREQRRQLRELSATAGVFSTLDRMAEVGMIHWEERPQRRLLIEQTLAVVMIQRPEAWQNFIQNCYLWTYYQQCQAAWDAYMQREEMKAVRDVMKAREIAGEPKLSRADIDRIRTARRAEIAESDMQAPAVEPFEFFIVRAAGTAEIPQSTGRQQAAGGAKSQAAGELVAVGRFDPETDTQTVRLWSEIAPLLQRPADG